ncbi:MAG: DUF1592 domain-containing protein [Gemmatimonadetes bacterium]|nr:DUF1592 domain-containing protein [Gemmatimonadota bacterium]
MIKLKTALFTTSSVALGVVLGTSGVQKEAGVPQTWLGAATPLATSHAALQGPVVDDNEIVQEFCVRCHNDRRLRGNLSLEGFNADNPSSDAELAEKIIRKLRAGMMPPAGSRRPEESVLEALAVSMEEEVDAEAAKAPDPGSRPFQRLNRAEYERAIFDLLGLQIDASAYLPNETVSAGFDNIADVQNLSATLLDAYLTAAAEVSRMAMGDPGATAAEATYEVSRYAEQREHVPGTPFGTRGGISVVHNFTADGDYFFRLAFQHESTGNLFGQTAPFDEQVEVSIDGERVALIPLDRWMHRQDPGGVEVVTERIPVTAGEHRVAAAFVKTFEGPVEDLTSPHEWSLADKKIGYSYGITSLIHLRDLTIGGPFDVKGAGNPPAKARILTCRPEGADGERACARTIAERLARRAYRRPVEEGEVDALMALYDEASQGEGFEIGVRTVLQGILASPDFIFRLEEVPEGTAEGSTYRISDVDLASRLSFFLWGGPPDEALIRAAAAGELSTSEGMDRQIDRMLADPRADALGTRFAAQWLRLQDLDKVHPDALRYPDFHAGLAEDMKRETERFFNELVRQDGSFFDLLTADYSYMNERLARHYAIPGVNGPAFRRVSYTGEARRGLLGHGSILTLTSHANRTSPVLRGKWIMEVLLGSPPPPPPPDVPELEATAEAAEGRFLTVRERMEQHRANPSCNSCHRVIDPLGLALENFDVTGTWRIRDAGAAVETAGELYDGTPIADASGLREALLKRPESLARSFTENLMAYALGRRVEYADMPAVRIITAEARGEGYGMQSFIKGVAHSPAFQMAKVPGVVVEEPAGSGEENLETDPNGN